MELRQCCDGEWAWVRAGSWESLTVIEEACGKTRARRYSVKTEFGGNLIMVA